MEGEELIFFDSNYWIYLFDKNTPEHAYIKAHFESIYDQTCFAVNVIIMVEVMHYLIKRLGVVIAKEKWKLFKSIIFSIEDLIQDELDIVFSELCRYTHVGIGGRDATILTHIKKKNIKKICSHDKSFKKIEELEVIDPIPKYI